MIGLRSPLAPLPVVLGKGCMNHRLSVNRKSIVLSSMKLTVVMRCSSDSLFWQRNVEDVSVSDIEIETRTMLNSKTQPQLRLGQNTVFVDVGEPTDTVMIWPDLQGENYRNYVAAEKNIATEATHKGWPGVMFAEKPGEEAFTIYRVVTPRPIKRVVYGGRFYNRAPNGQISLLHSFDGGATWDLDWRLTETSQPWDVIHYVTLTNIPADAREVLLKY